MKTVQDILRQKGNNIWSVSPDTMVYDALKLMADKGVGALLVMEKDKLVGIVSERDYARKIILKGKASKDTPIKEIMTERVIYVSPQQSAEECLALMNSKRIRHLPVFEGDNLVGVISIRDVAQAVIDEKEVHIEQLEDYIIGRR